MNVDWREERLTNEDGIPGHIRAHEDDYFRQKDRELIESLRNADAAAKAQRALIVNLARSRGIAAGSHADHQLAQWLDIRPSDEAFHKATRLIGAMLEAPEHRVNVTADDLIDYCDRIAHASGGIFGIGAVSPAERVVLEEISTTLKTR